MIGLVVVEWCYQALNPRRTDEIQADYQAGSYDIMHADYLAKAGEIRRQIEVEDAKHGTKDYDSAWIYDLLAQETEWLDMAAAAQIGYVDSKLASSRW